MLSSHIESVLLLLVRASANSICGRLLAVNSIAVSSWEIVSVGFVVRIRVAVRGGLAAG